MNIRGRFDTATRAGRPNPLHDFKRLAFGFLATSTAAEVYHNQDNAWRKLWLCFCNTTGSARTISGYVVTSGGSVGDSHAFLRGTPIAANETLWLPMEVMVDTDEKLYLTSDGATAVTCMAIAEVQG